MPRSPKNKSYSDDPLEQLAYEIAEKVYVDTDGKEEYLEVDEVFAMVRAELDKRVGTFSADKKEEIFEDAKGILTAWSTLRWTAKHNKKSKTKRKPKTAKERPKLKVWVNKDEPI